MGVLPHSTTRQGSRSSTEEGVCESQSRRGRQLTVCSGLIGCRWQLQWQREAPVCRAIGPVVLCRSEEGDKVLRLRSGKERLDYWVAASLFRWARHRADAEGLGAAAVLVQRGGCNESFVCVLQWHHAAPHAASRACSPLPSLHGRRGVSSSFKSDVSATSVNQR